MAIGACTGCHHQQGKPDTAFVRYTRRKIGIVSDGSKKLGLFLADLGECELVTQRLPDTAERRAHVFVERATYPNKFGALRR